MRVIVAGSRTCKKYSIVKEAIGYRRNEEMASKADALVCCWDGESRGSKHMIDIAKRAGLKVFVHKFEYIKKL